MDLIITAGIVLIYLIVIAVIFFLWCLIRHVDDLNETFGMRVLELQQFCKDMQSDLSSTKEKLADIDAVVADHNVELDDIKDRITLIEEAEERKARA